MPFFKIQNTGKYGLNRMKSLISKNNFIYNQYAGLGALSFVNGGV
jgi:hypothetical protein